MTKTSSIDRLLIGDNPFNGVDHLSQERSREKVLGLSTQNIVDVIETAFENGAEGISFSTHPNMYNVLRHMRNTEYGGEFGLYPVLPDVQASVRVVSEKGMVGLILDAFGKMDAGTKAKSIVQGGIGALTLDPIRLMKTYLTAEISAFINIAPRNAHLKSVFLHEIATDLIVSLEMEHLFTDYISFIEDSFHVLPGFVTRNFARFVEFIDKINMPAQRIVVLTPFNKAGFQMNPTQQDCEKKLLQHPDLNVIAMSVLASGYSGLDEAIDYLLQIKRTVSCVIGVSTERHAVETFSKFKSRLYAT